VLALACVAAANTYAACSGSVSSSAGNSDAGRTGASTGATQSSGAGASGKGGAASQRKDGVTPSTAGNAATAGATGSAGRRAGGSGTSGANTAGKSSSAGAGGQNAGAAGQGGDEVPGDTYLPWAGGPAYYAKWSNGLPSDPNFFPIAVWLQSPPNATRYKDIGINLFVGLWDGPTSDQLSQLTTAGVPTVCDQSGVWHDHLSDPTLWGWLQPDEPDNAQAKQGGGYDPCIDPSKIVAGYDTMVANDATRPVWLGLGRGVSDTQWVGRGDCTGKTDMYPEYAKGGDILSFDIYPVDSGIGLEAVPKGVDNLRMWSNYEKPVVADIEGSNIDGKARPTPSQIKSEVWMALIHGAAGIQYFCHRFMPDFSETDCLDDAAAAAGIKTINTRITALAPVLNTRSVANGVTVTPSDPAHPVDIMLKRSGGATYLFAVAMTNASTSAHFTLRDPPATATAEVLDETRDLAITNGTFDDTFDAYGVHLYKITH
jgi:hypothetical protein